MADGIQQKFISALRARTKARFPCPFCEHRVFEEEEKLDSHIRNDHEEKLQEHTQNDAAASLFRKRQAVEKLNVLANETPRIHPIKKDPSNMSADAAPWQNLEIHKLTIQPDPVTGGTLDPKNPRPRANKRRAGSDIQPREAHQKSPARQEQSRRPKVADPGRSRSPYQAMQVNRPSGPNRSMQASFDSMSAEFSRPQPAQQQQLFNPNAASSFGPSPTPQKGSPLSNINSNFNLSASSQSHRGGPGDQQLRNSQPGLLRLPAESRDPSLLLQPDSRPISQEQLAAEVKSIYAGLTMVETKCIHVVQAQAASAFHEAESGSQNKLVNDHWQALIALHRTLLHEHHDFFLASQHPSASPALRQLAHKYSMPARMWKHGIHSFLELLRRRLPDTLDYMLAFIYLAYQMMALLYETVPAFEETWIECLGDLGRYRMAVEDEDVRDRETWAGVARFWYSKAADKKPHVGRLYHHLAILARPNALQQLYYYCRSLTCLEPFMSARESILTLLNPILEDKYNSYLNAFQVDINFIKSHAYLFTKKDLDRYEQTSKDFLKELDSQIGRVTAKWKEQGVYTAVTNLAALLGYGTKENPLRQAFEKEAQDTASASQEFESTKTLEGGGKGSKGPDPEPADPALEKRIQDDISDLYSQPIFKRAANLTFSTLRVVAGRIGDKNSLPHFHVNLVFLYNLAKLSFDCSNILQKVPWNEVIGFLNTLSRTEMNSIMRSEKYGSSILSSEFPHKNDSDRRPLPEDYWIRGQVYNSSFYPENWFPTAHDEEERYLELASTAQLRTERVLWLGVRLAKKASQWIIFDSEHRQWSLAEIEAKRESSNQISRPYNGRVAASQTLADMGNTKRRPEEDDTKQISRAHNEYGASIEPSIEPVEAMEIDQPKDPSDCNEQAVNPLASPRQDISLSARLDTASKAESFEIILSRKDLVRIKDIKNKIDPDHTRIMFDLDFLLNHKDLFEEAIKKKLFIIDISEIVIMRLIDESQNSGSDSASAALKSIENALENRNKFSICDSNGKELKELRTLNELSASNEDEDSEDTAIVSWGRTQRNTNQSTKGNLLPAMIVTEREVLKMRADRVRLPRLSYTDMAHLLSESCNILPDVSMDTEAP